MNIRITGLAFEQFQFKQLKKKVQWNVDWKYTIALPTQFFNFALCITFTDLKKKKRWEIKLSKLYTQENLSFGIWMTNN